MAAMKHMIGKKVPPDEKLVLGKYGNPVDIRFSKILEDALKKTYLLPRQLTVTDVYRALGVSRATMYEWLNRKANISKKTVFPFKDDPGWLGEIARQVLEVIEGEQE